MNKIVFVWHTSGPMITLVWLFTNMFCLMIYKCSFSEQILPHWSHEYGFSSECTLWCLRVTGALPCLYKNFITLHTWILFLLSVYRHMIFKISYLCINFVTQAALVWFHPSMWSHMIFKVMHLPKSLVTSGWIGMVSHQCVFSYDL